ncbi:MAG: hypothetical protein HQL32_09630, partial [Planctomycetes bacterium]|nr:hypothetical protein [Planctomycetota bacterium]
MKRGLTTFIMPLGLIIVMPLILFILSTGANFLYPAPLWHFAAFLCFLFFAQVYVSRRFAKSAKNLILRSAQEETELKNKLEKLRDLCAAIPAHKRSVNKLVREALSKRETEIQERQASTEPRWETLFMASILLLIDIAVAFRLQPHFLIAGPLITGSLLSIPTWRIKRIHNRIKVSIHQLQEDYSLLQKEKDQNWDSRREYWEKKKESEYEVWKMTQNRENDLWLKQWQKGTLETAKNTSTPRKDPHSTTAKSTFKQSYNGKAE